MKDIIFFVLIVLAAEVISWVGTVWIIKFITLCFGWKFSFSAATGIWLVLCLIGSCILRK